MHSPEYQEIQKHLKYGNALIITAFCISLPLALFLAGIIKI